MLGYCRVDNRETSVSTLALIITSVWECQTAKDAPHQLKGDIPHD